MPTQGGNGEGARGRRQMGFAAGVLLFALSTLYTSDGTQQVVARSLQASVLRPFIGLQETLTQARLRAMEIELLVDELDSLTAIVSTQAALEDENRTLRELLGLTPRLTPSFLPASVLRPGTPGSESMFLVDLGETDGIQVGAPVVGPRGLVGQIRDVRPENSVGMDWSHPDFRASAMTVDGSSYGIVENRRGAFREQDRLVLNGTAFNEDIAEGVTIVTSGLGRFPRGIPIGRVGEVAEAQGSWLKSYWLEPMVQPGSATHVLVATGDPSGTLSGEWPPDSAVVADSVGGGPDW